MFYLVEGLLVDKENLQEDDLVIPLGPVPDPDLDCCQDVQSILTQALLTYEQLPDSFKLDLVSEDFGTILEKIKNGRYGGMS